MNVYEYFNSMQLGLPFNTVISNYLIDLKVSILLSLLALSLTPTSSHTTILKLTIKSST